MEGSSNLFRKEYRQLTEQEKSLILQIKSTAQVLADLLGYVNVPQSDATGYTSHEARCVELAFVRLEESVMWATKAITK